VTTFRIRLDQRARKNLASLDPVVRRRIAKALDALSTDPRPAGCKPLKGLEGSCGSASAITASST